MNENGYGLLPTEEENMEIDLMDLFSWYLTKWPIILGGLVAGAIIAGLFTFFMITPNYTATSKLYVVSSSTDSVVDLTDLNIGTSLSADYAELLKVRPILEEIIEQKKLPYTYEQLLGMTNISTIAETRILVINVTSTSPKEAKTIANSLAKIAVKEIPRLMDTAKPNIAEEAIVPEHKSSPSLTKNTLIGGLLGMLLVMGIFTVIYLMDDTLNTAEDVEKVFGVMPLTVIPEGKMDESEKDSAGSGISLKGLNK